MKGMYGAVSILGLMAIFLEMQLSFVMAGCPLDLSRSNVTLLASICSNHDNRGKCCRYINAFVAVSNARYANATGTLGVSSDMSEVCLSTISETFKLYGVPQNATAFCGFGTKILVSYECKGRTTVGQMLQSPGFGDVAENCKVSLLEENECKKCINSTIKYLHHNIEAEDNVTLNTCRDATFTALSSKSDNASVAEFASCFFRVPDVSTAVSRSPSYSIPPTNSASPLVAGSPSRRPFRVPFNGNQHPYRVKVITGVASAATVVFIMLLVVLISLIRRKSRELEDSEISVKLSMGAFPPSRPVQRIPEGHYSMCRKFSYKEIKKATNKFSTVIGGGEFGEMYKAQFSDGSIAVVKRISRGSEQAKDDFYREIELLARLHHRHLVALRGFCIEKQQRFLMYEFMEKGSLKDHLHSPSRAPLSWKTRIKIAIDVANALEYLHFCCDPPLCHRDIKSSNILLDENYAAKVADFGLVHASNKVYICSELTNADIQRTPGYTDPEYVVTGELNENSDVYSYGVVLLELVTARQAIQHGENLVEWTREFMDLESRLPELVDPRLGDSFNYNQLETIMMIARWCTQNDGRARPSIKQVLRILYESSDPLQNEFIQVVEDEENQGSRRTRQRKIQSCDAIFHSGDGRYLASSSSTSRSYCSRTFLLENGSP